MAHDSDELSEEAVKQYRIFLVLACVLMAAPYSRAQIAISSTSGLEFGKFAAGSGGFIAVDTNGARSRSGGVVLLNSGTGTAAAFNISDPDSGNLGRSYIITLPDNGTVLLTSGSNSMGVNNFTSDPSDSSVMATGTQTLTVGATLSVGADQPVGSYSGNFTVILNYQ